jgi:hypothetical protein
MRCLIARLSLSLLVILLVGCFSKSDRAIPPEIAQANDLRQMQGWVLVAILENQTNSSAMSNFNEFLTTEIQGVIKKYHWEDQLHDFYVSTNRLKWENAINPGGPDRTNVLMLLKVAKGFWVVTGRRHAHEYTAREKRCTVRLPSHRDALADSYTSEQVHP